MFIKAIFDNNPYTVVDWEDSRMFVMLICVVALFLIPFILHKLLGRNTKLDLKFSTLYITLYAIPYYFFKLSNITTLIKKIKKYERLLDIETDQFLINKYEIILDELTKEHMEYILRYDLANKLIEEKYL